MTYEQAIEKIRELNARGWAFSMSQGMGRQVVSEFSGGFMHYKGGSAGEFYAPTFPELVCVAWAAVVEAEVRWNAVAQKR
jgi:hypothetical protein